MVSVEYVSSVRELIATKGGPVEPSAILPAIPWHPRDLRLEAFEALPIPVLVVDEAGRIAAWNQAMLALAHKPASALAGQLWWRLLSPRRDTAGALSVYCRPEPGTRRGFTLHGGAGDRAVLVQSA